MTVWQKRSRASSIETTGSRKCASRRTSAYPSIQPGHRCCTGDYIAFLDHDDLLEPGTLFEYVSAINSDAEIDLLYCDEDKLFPNGTYGDPYFKPDFSPHLLREVNYICHFLMIRSSLLARLEPADPTFDGAQDHRMILQAVEKAREYAIYPTFCTIGA